MRVRNMSDRGHQSERRSSKAWWVAVALLGAAVVIDVVDGQALKLLTSASLFIGCLLAAALPHPRSSAATLAIVGCLVGGAGLIVYRIAVAGL
jgi:lysylphosphatidylglycerol synthetase-like protein (DUF2156 family)